MENNATVSSKAKQYRNRFYQLLVQFFCRHSYERINKDEILPAPNEGEAIMHQRIHICCKCGKHQMLGSGWILG